MTTASPPGVRTAECARCRNEGRPFVKPVTEFYPHKGRGLCSYCKTCSKAAVTARKRRSQAAALVGKTDRELAWLRRCLAERLALVDEEIAARRQDGG